MDDKNLLKKYFHFSIGTWVTLILGLISTPITTRLMLPAEFGKASMFIVAINVILIIVMAGNDQAFIRFFYEEDEDKRKKLLFTCLRVPLINFSVIAVLIVIFKEFVSEFLFTEVNIPLIYALIIAVFIAVFNRYALLVIRMEQKGKAYSLVQILGKASNIVFFVMFVLIFGGIYDVIVYTYVLEVILMLAVGIYLGRRYWNFKRTLGGLKSSFKEMLIYSSPFIITGLISYVFTTFDRFAIKQWAGVEELGLYTAALRYILVLELLRKSFAQFWTPTAYKHFKNNPKDTSFYTNINSIVSVVILFLGFALIMFKDVLVFILGPEYRAASMIFPFLVLMPVMSIVNETTVMGINFSKKTKWHLPITLIACLVNIAGNYFLVPLFGAAGAAISTGASYILFFTIRTFVSYKLYNVDYNLAKFYISTIVISSYAFYNTFIVWNIFNPILGLVGLSIVSFLYRDSVISILDKVRSVIKKRKAV